MKFEPIASGFGLTEAPHADVRGVWFSDMAVGGIRCLRSDGRIDAWLTERKTIGGIAFNRDNRIICSGTGGLVWLDPETGSSGSLLDNIDGRPIGGINDMIANRHGGLFFGLVDHPSMFRGERMGPSALCRFDADGRVALLRDGLRFANGFGISPDGTTLYHNDSSRGTCAYTLAADGSLSGDSMLCEYGDCDGLAVDGEGGVWIARIVSGVIIRVMPGGAVAAEYAVPGGHVTSLCFGGADLRDLYVTTAAPDGGAAVMKRTIPSALTGTIYRARADVAGMPDARTAFRLPED
ncbi:MAG: SMP-30/gluconolactonase/LRE family protein [Rhizomicrobium sp.]